MKDLKIALAALALATVLLGLVYPAVVTVAAQAAFPRQAAGDPDLIGVAVTDPRDLWGRPSATAPGPYNAMASTGTNAGPLSPALADAVKQRIAALRAADPTAPLPVPADLVTSSASGLDPHISPAAAYYQAPRIARARGLAVDQVRAVIAAHVEGPQLGVLGDPRVNVRAVNRALDAAVR